MDKQQDKSTKPQEFGPQRKPVLLCLPYTGINGNKIKRQLHRLLSATVPWIELKLVFAPKFKLSKLSLLKCPINTMTKSGVVYKIQCLDCDNFYVGMTNRRLKKRVSEHSEDTNSALKQHANINNHKIDFEGTSILCADNVRARLFVKEALKIKELSAHLSLNRNIRGCDLKLW